MPTLAVPGRYGQNYLGFNKYYSLPDDYANTPAGGYGSPVDLKGTMAIGLDPRGQPLYQDPLASPLQTLLLPDPGVPPAPRIPISEQSRPIRMDESSPKIPHGLPTPSTNANDDL